MGPKQTKCNITEEIQAEDFNLFCVALTTTMTPDVPSGSSFQVMTKYCMMWAGGSSTRILITCTIEWSKSSWIKSAIEKGASEGQIAFAKDLISEFRKTLESGSGGGLTAKQKTVNRKKSGKRKRDDQRGAGPEETQAAEPIKSWSSDGLIGSLTSYISPLVRALFSTTGFTALLFMLVLVILLRVELVMKKVSLLQSEVSPELGKTKFFELAGEADLWDWVSTRVERVSKEIQDGRYVWNNLEKGIAMSDNGLKDVEEAIRVTEKKLTALKGAVSRNT
jgi:hypothetical protein